MFEFNDIRDLIASVDSLKSKKVTIFHHSDMDGYVGAATVRKVLTGSGFGPLFNWESISTAPVNYNGNWNEGQIREAALDGGIVIVVDFAFPTEISDFIAEHAGFFVTLDHHVTNKEMLEGKPYAIFDMKSSGAKMAYDWCNMASVTTPRLPLITVLADNRDLWNKTDGREDSLHMVLMEKKESMSETEYLDLLGNCITSDRLTAELAQEGEAMVKKMNANIAYACQDENLYHTTLGGHPAVIVNYPVDQSDACQYLYTQDAYKGKICATISFKRGVANFSLRKNKELDIDLRQIAEIHYGGGGHKAAAGFEVPMQRGLNILMNKEKWAMCWDANEIQDALNIAMSGTDLYQRLSSLTPVLRSRVVCESDLSLRQVLPYIILRNEDGKIFTYNRPSSGDESRIHGNSSIGLGGHVDTIPSENVSLAHHLGHEAARELMEEVGLTSDDFDVVGAVEEVLEHGDFATLALDTSAVESVHFGIAVILDVKSEWLRNINLEEVINSEWVSVDKLRLMSGTAAPFEMWSEIIINSDPTFLIKV